MAEEKTFFRKPTERELLRDENLTKIYRQNGLVSILERNEGPFLLHFSLIPGYFYRADRTPYEASREYSKRGELIKVRHPQTFSECAFSHQTFYDVFTQSLKETFKKINLYDNKFLGYSFQPLWGDRQRREVFFSELLAGFFSYLYFREASPIEVDDRYVGNYQRKDIGAQIIVSVPSRRKEQRRYRFKFSNVPFHKRANNLGISLILKSSMGGLEESSRPPSDLYLIKYKEREGTLSSLAMRFFPQDIAAYYAIAEKQKNKGNSIPENFSPFPFPSEELIKFYIKVRNRTLVLDPFSRKPTRRFLYEQEISRAISLFLHRKERDLNNLFLREFKEENYVFLKDEIQKSLEGKSPKES